MSGTRQGAAGIGGLLEIYVAGGASSQFAEVEGNANVVGLIDASLGSSAASYEYSTFGALLKAEGSGARKNPIGFSSKYWDAECDLPYYGQRYYNPGTGRWLSRDPTEENGGKNLYCFNNNDSLNAIDPLGLRSVRIEADAFIPWDWIELPSVSYHGVTDTSYIRGDNRDFSTNTNASSRIRDWVDVEVQRSGSDVEYTNGSRIQDSARRDDFSVYGFHIGSHTTVATGTISSTERATRIDCNTVEVELSAVGQVSSKVAPFQGSIKYDYVVRVREMAGSDSIGAELISYTHTSFPSHEFVVDGKFLHEFSAQLGFVGPFIRLHGFDPVTKLVMKYRKMGIALLLSGCLGNNVPHIHIILPTDYKGIIRVRIDPDYGLSVPLVGGIYNVHIPRDGTISIKSDQLFIEPHDMETTDERGMAVPYEYDSGIGPKSIAFRSVGMLRQSSDKDRIYEFVVGTDEEVQYARGQVRQNGR